MGCAGSDGVCWAKLSTADDMDVLQTPAVLLIQEGKSL